MKKICFVICPIGEEGSGERKHANRVRDEIIKPVVGNEFGYHVVRADEYHVIGQITNQIVKFIVESELVIADLSYRNPNVFYELALRHVTRKPVIHIIRKGENIPFDIKDIRAIEFDLGDANKVKQAKSVLRGQIRSLESGEFGAIQYISTLLGRLEIIFHALQQLGEGKLLDDSGLKFGRRSYKNLVLGTLYVCDATGDELLLENIEVSRIDASNAKLGTFYIKNCMINHIDVSGCQIKRLIVEGTRINVTDMSGASIDVVIQKEVLFINPVDVTGATIKETIKK